MSAGFPAKAPGRTGLRFAGYAAIFGWPDRGGDVVRAGAFARSLGRRAAPVPVLWQHDWRRPVGRIEYVKEDRRGLRVIARLSNGPLGREAAARLSSGEAGLSFGYVARKAVRLGGMRELTDVDLVEVSLVRIPMQPKARVHAVDDPGPRLFRRQAPWRARGNHRTNG